MTSMTRFSVFSLGAVLILSAVGCGEAPSVPQVTSSAIAEDIVLPNAYCPLMGGKIDEDTSVAWGDQKVYFCCPPCIDEWNEMTDEERNAKLREVQNEHAGDEHDHGAHGDHEEGDAEADADATEEAAGEVESAAAGDAEAEAGTEEAAGESAE